MWPSTTHLTEQLCLREDDAGPIRGHLSDDPRVEAVLQALLVFGPTAWLLIGASFRIAQLWEAKLVVLPNRRGYLKAVSISNKGETVAAPLTYIYLAQRLHPLRFKVSLPSSRHSGTRPLEAVGSTTAFLGRCYSCMCALVPRARPKCRTIQSLDQLSCYHNSQRCHPSWPFIRGLEPLQPMGSRICYFRYQICPSRPRRPDQEVYSPRAL